MTTHLRLLALSLIAVGLTAGGCGKSSKPLTRAELIAKADVICKQVNDKLKSQTINSRQELVHAVTRIASTEQAALAELSKLVPPAGLADDWKTIIAGAQTLADNTAKLGEYAKANRLNAAKSLIASSQKVQQQMLAIAKRDGFKYCSQNV